MCQVELEIEFYFFKGSQSLIEFVMDAFGAIAAILPLLTLFSSVPSFDDCKRILEGKLECLKAKIHDMENIIGIESCPSKCGIRTTSKKRKRDNNLSIWVSQGRELLKQAENFLTQIEDASILTRVKRRKVMQDVVDALKVHDKKGGMLYELALFDERGSLCRNYIPVKDMTARSALNTLEGLEHLLQQDGKFGRIAIVGREGIGKTFMMKHLHNSALKWGERFDCILWVTVTSPYQFCIKLVQDAVAASVKCAFAREDDEDARAKKLFKALIDVGKFVLFLDGVPKSDSSLEEIGIPVPIEGSESRLVLTTSCTSGCRMLNGFRTVEIEPLSENEAIELFMQESKIDNVNLYHNIPRLLARECCGVPRKVVNTASRMYGIDDIHEWRNALFELQRLQ